MSGNPGWIWHGDQGPPPLPQVLGATSDGSACGGVLHINLLWIERGVIQGDPLSSTIFNVVVDAVVRHWESLIA